MNATASSTTSPPFRVTVIRPVIEYCTLVWHYAITRSQAEQLESIHKRAIYIIYPVARGMPHSDILFIR